MDCFGTFAKIYVVNDEVKLHIRAFFDAFYARWRSVTLDDRDMSQFADNRQQSANDMRERDLVLRQLFFEYLKAQKYELIAKDTQRAFNEAERIAIYRSGKALCIACKSEGKSDEEATIAWNEYEADHVVPHSKGRSNVIGQRSTPLPLSQSIKGRTNCVSCMTSPPS